jgi:hypothetical protein
MWKEGVPMKFGDTGKTESPVAEAPEEPIDSAITGVRPGSNGVGQDSQESVSLFLIIHSTAENERKVYRCDEEQEAKMFLEMLTADGVDREDIELFHASTVPFSLSYRPVVDFEVP